MQNSLPIPHSLTDVFWFVLAISLSSLIGGGSLAAILNIILNRKKPLAEIHESEARVAKTFAEARSLDLQSNIEAGDAVLRMVQQLTFAQIANEKLREENEKLTNENETYEQQMRRAKALLKLNNINFDEA